MDEEGEDQENEKDNRREDGQQRVEGRIAESAADCYQLCTIWLQQIF